MQTLEPIATEEKKTDLAPIGTPTTGVNTPTLQDFIKEAQKLGQTSIQAQKDILNQNIGETGDALLRKIHGQNVGASSGVGQQIIGRQIGEMSKRLEPIATQVGTQLGQQALEMQYNKSNTDLADAYNLVQSGQMTGEQAKQVLAQKGINAESYMTPDQLAVKKQDDELIKLKQNIKDPLVADTINSIEEFNYYMQNGRTYDEEVIDIIETSKTLAQWKEKLPILQQQLASLNSQIQNEAGKGNSWWGDLWGNSADQKKIAHWQAKAQALEQMINEVRAGKLPVSDVNTI